MAYNFLMDQEFQKFINSQLELPYFIKIMNFLHQELNLNKTIFPQLPDLFKAFEITPFQKMKVVIFGQDPYHQDHVADGLAFSTKLSKTPKSLANIFQEIKNEEPKTILLSNDLSPWASQGVLLLNTTLSVEKGKPNSHHKIGWNIFIQNFIEYLNTHKDFLIFVLWGKQAQKLKPLINQKFIILESAHPSPLSAYAGFFGNEHFKTINEIITSKKLPIIKWDLPSKINTVN